MQRPEVSEHVIFHRWSAEVVLELSKGPRYFNGLLNGIRGISDRILFVRLAELLAEGLVDRTVLLGPPVRVLYGLTVAGRRYVEPVEDLAALQAEPALQEAAVG